MRHARRRYSSARYGREAQARRIGRFEGMACADVRSALETLRAVQTELLADQAQPFPRQSEIDAARGQADMCRAEAELERKEGARSFGVVRSRVSVSKEQQALKKAREAQAKAQTLEREKSSREVQIAAHLREIAFDIAAATTHMNKASREARRTEEARRKQAREAEKKQAVAARLAAAERTSRELARAVRASIAKCDLCPYCQAELPSDAECDHIVPVAKGGLSTAPNMVYVCKPCNQAKGGMTLLQFCRAKGYDFMTVVARLEKAGKVV